MKRFQKILMKDLGWKLLSVAIAAIMWFMVINITQPVDTRSYSRPIVLENTEALTNRGLTVGNAEELKNTKITVKVKAQRTALDRLNQNPEWIHATVDFSELAYAVNGESVVLPVNVTIQNSSTYGISSKSPAVVEVEVETLASKELPVEVVLNGTLAEGTYLSQPTLSTETIMVTGPASAVNQVAAVRASINAEDIQEAQEIRTKLTACNAEGTAVKGVSTNISEITVSYALHDMKQIPIQVDITGTPANGYEIGTIICTPKYAEVTGSAEALENLLYLQMDSIDISNRSTNAARTFSLLDYLPEGVSLKEGSSDTVQIIVEITTQSSKQFTLPASSLTMEGQEDGKTYTLIGDAHITVSGDSETLEALQADSLKGTINVSGLSEGEHRVMILTELPDGLILNPSYITVTISGVTNTPENE